MEPNDDFDFLAEFDELLTEELELRTLDEYLLEALEMKEDENEIWEEWFVDDEVGDGEDVYSEA
jgi:hypothetical protein